MSVLQPEADGSQVLPQEDMEKACIGVHRRASKRVRLSQIRLYKK